MKKQLLLASLLLGSFITMNAQVIGFETAEGYTAGNSIAGQNGWNVTAAATLSTVSPTYSAGGGVNSLKIAGNNGTVHTLAGAFSPVRVVNGTVISTSMDIYFSGFSATSSDFQVLIQSPSQAKVAARVIFDYTGTITMLDAADPADPTALDYEESTAAPLVAGRWYNFKIVMNTLANTIQYYLDNNIIYTGVVFGATNVEQIVLANDNYNSTAYFDNIQYTAGALSVGEKVTANFSVYPNPATSVVNISNTTNSSINNVEIVDLNGRTVKSVKFNGVSSAEINVSDLTAGVYMMNISSEEGTTTKKIIKN